MRKQLIVGGLLAAVVLVTAVAVYVAWPRPVTFQGTDTGSTTQEVGPVVLNGSYRITWQGQPDTNARDCAIAIGLWGPESRTIGPFGNIDPFLRPRPLTGTDTLGQMRGSYRVLVGSTCERWQVTFDPVR